MRAHGHRSPRSPNRATSPTRSSPKPTTASATSPAAFTDVVVYQAADLPTNVTQSQYFAAQGIRYRYFNGRTWGPEELLTTGDDDDSQPTVSFNAQGQGIAAWVHNTDANPIGDNGDFDSSADEIEVAVWNKATHSFSAPMKLTNDSVDDSQPTVLAGADGTLRVEWLRATAGGGNEIYYSSYNGTTWSTPAQLPTTGLPANGVIQDIALGQDGAGNVHTLIADRSVMSDGTVNWQLLDRISPASVLDRTHDARDRLHRGHTIPRSR